MNHKGTSPPPASDSTTRKRGADSPFTLDHRIGGHRGDRISRRGGRLLTYDREDARRLAQAAYRKQDYDQHRKPEPEMEQVPTLDGLLSLQPAMPFEKVRFTNPDLTYLWRKSGFSHRFIGKMLGWFGEVVVLEGLRSSVEQNIQSEPLFVTICRRLEIG